MLNLLHAVDQPRICAWTVTSSAVVGSSAIRMFVEERHRDHRALAHPARVLVRVVADALLRGAGSRRR